MSPPVFPQYLGVPELVSAQSRAGEFDDFTISPALGHGSDLQFCQAVRGQYLTSTFQVPRTCIMRPTRFPSFHRRCRIGATAAARMHSPPEQTATHTAAWVRPEILSPYGRFIRPGGKARARSPARRISRLVQRSTRDGLEPASGRSPTRRWHI